MTNHIGARAIAPPRTLSTTSAARRPIAAASPAPLRQPAPLVTPDDRRLPENRALRAALDALAHTIMARRPGAEVRSGVDVCAEHARRRGMPAERFLVSLKRVLDSGTDLSRRDEPVGGGRASWTPYQRLVTLAIAAYYRVQPPPPAVRSAVPSYSATTRSSACGHVPRASYSGW